MAIASKGKIINNAYSHVRISGITVDPSPREKERALGVLEEMAAEFEGRNICMEYLFEEAPNTASSTGVNIKFNYMLATNLAMRLIPDFGKKSSANDSLILLRQQAVSSLSTASSATAVVNQMIYPRRMARGSGNTFRWNHLRRYTHESQPAPISCDTIQMPLNTVLAVTQSWLDELATAETITSTIVTYTDGLLQTVAPAISANGKEVSFTVQSRKSGAECATIQIITNLSTPFNKDVRIVNFNILTNNTLNA